MVWCRNSSGKSNCAPGTGSWDGSYAVPASATKEFECFVDYDGQSLLGLRLHRVRVELFPMQPGRNTTSVRYSLISRSRNASSMLCGPSAYEMDCQLTNCVVSGAPDCTSLDYACDAKCSSDVASSSPIWSMVVASLNNPSNWPLHVAITDADVTT